MTTNQAVGETILEVGVPEVFEPSDKVAVIRTTDRINFRSCRRKWNFSSHLRMNLGGKQQANPLWLGSGIHFALEDMYGPKKYKNAKQAMRAYAIATQRHKAESLPEDFEQLLQLGEDMMEYYDVWLDGRDFMPTYIKDGVPQVEANIRIELPKKLIPNNEHIPYEKVYCSFTLDRISWDEELNGIWIVEYKTAAQMATMHFLNDPQVTAYCWAAAQVYTDVNILGVCYQQHKKTLPKPARVLKSGEISSAKNQSTSAKLYRKGLIEKYGEVSKAPADCVRFLNDLTAQESPDHDAFIRRDFIYRNDHMSKAETHKIVQEASEMLNPNTFMYPNPNRMQCSMMCSFLSACVGMDDGSGYEDELRTNFEERPRSYDEWRKYLPEADKMKEV